MSESRFYVVLATDRPGMGHVRAAARPAHRAYLRAQAAVRVYSAGPLIDESGGAMEGTFVLCGADSREAVERFVAADPYSRSDLFAQVIIRRLDWTLANPLPFVAASAPDGLTDQAAR
jgi:uncharacterized protein YciI